MAKKKSTTRARAAKASSVKKTAKKKPAGKKKAKKKKAARKKTTKAKTAKKKVVKKKAAKKKAAKKKTTKAKTAKKKVVKKKAAKKKGATKSPSKPAGRKKVATAPKLELDEAPPKPVKTHLSRKELLYYRNLLLVKRAELLGDMSSMSEEALSSVSTDLSHVPLHMADVGSENHDKELMLGLAESERRTIHEIDDALQRIADRTYGVCQATQSKISKARLEAKPWAKYCIEAARAMERRGSQ